MMNLFEWSAGVASVERSRRDGSSRRRGRSDPTAKARNLIGDDKLVRREPRRKNSSSEVSMKMLIEEEMLRERVIWQGSPDVVANLMGLDASPDRLLDVVLRKIERRTRTARGATRSHPRKENVGRNFRPLGSYIIALSGGRSKNGRGQDADSREATTAFTRWKFPEAKRVAADQRAIRSENLREVTGFLGSNRDLFLVHLERPDPQSASPLRGARRRRPPPPRDKRITVLKPSEIDRNFRCTANQSLCARHLVLRKKPEKPLHPIRIVVLKPSTQKPIETGDPLSPSIAAARRTGEDSGRDEALPSPVPSNGYAGDGSTVYLSWDEEGTDESELATPTSRRHSWDGSLCSWSSTRGSHSNSPESPVIKEAKKRLSRRLVRVNSSSKNQEEQEQGRGRLTSTLREVLAMPEMTRGVEMSMAPPASTRNSCCEERSDSTMSPSGKGEDVLGRLQRLRSVPSSSSAIAKPEASSSRTARATLKGKISSFFSWHGRKSGGDSSSPRSPSVRSDGIPSGSNVRHDACEGLPLLDIAEMQESENGSIESPRQPSPMSTLEAPFADGDCYDASRSREGESRRNASFRLWNDLPVAAD